VSSRGKYVNENRALEEAIKAAKRSPCSKSKRGVVLWCPEIYCSLTLGWNHPPEPMFCDGSEACRESCGKLCVHAEADALINAQHNVDGYSMLHVKVADGEAVPSGPPSCWQCSRLLLGAKIKKVWLLHEEGLKLYTARDFHEQTLKNCGLPAILPALEESPPEKRPLGF